MRLGLRADKTADKKSTTIWMLVVLNTPSGSQPITPATGDIAAAPALIGVQ